MRYWSIIRVLFLFLGTCSSVPGQEVFWATKLLGFSSEHRPAAYGLQYRAVQLLGPPNKLPSAGDSPCAWSPAEADSKTEEWVKVGFAKPLQPKQIFIGENFNPGALTAVYLYDTDGKEIRIASEEMLKRGPEPGRMLVLKPSLQENVRVNALKIVMNPSLVAGFNQIDAVGISESTQPFKLGVRVADELPAGLRKTALGKNVNSKWRENAPVVSPDGRTLYFTREHPDNVGRESKQDVWVSEIQADGEWGPARNIGFPINTWGDNAVLGISGTGKTLYLLNVYRPDGSLVEGFSKTHLTKSGWTFPLALRIEDMYNDHQPKITEMTISPTEDVMILSVQRRDTRGSKDLYVSFKKRDDTWTAPQNLGPVINTADYEGAPYLATDNKTLYFTSLGHRGYGSGDIFVSRRLDDTWLNWSEPLNLGPAINSPGWDSFFTIPASGEHAYMSSYNPATQSDDLFKVPLYPAITPESLFAFSGKLINQETGQPAGGNIEIRKKADNSLVSKLTADGETGEFQILLPFDSTYTIAASAKGFFPLEEEFTFYSSTTTTVADRVLSLYPLKTGQRLPLQRVQFAQSSAKLEEESLSQLKELAAIMNQYPGMEILLEGHTDNQGDFDKNLVLSEDRVKAVKNFLLEQGIPASRIQIKAWGPSRPVSNNLTEEARKQNRRVELTILKI